MGARLDTALISEPRRAIRDGARMSAFAKPNWTLPPHVQAPDQRSSLRRTWGPSPGGAA